MYILCILGLLDGRFSSFVQLLPGYLSLCIRFIWLWNRYNMQYMHLFLGCMFCTVGILINICYYFYNVYPYILCIICYYYQFSYSSSYTFVMISIGYGPFISLNYLWFVLHSPSLIIYIHRNSSDRILILGYGSCTLG